eukprot:6202034-Pleurochrysis_carterae.AAC.2
MLLSSAVTGWAFSGPLVARMLDATPGQRLRSVCLRAASDVPSLFCLHYSGEAPGPGLPFGFDIPGGARTDAESSHAHARQGTRPRLRTRAHASRRTLTSMSKQMNARTRSQAQTLKRVCARGRARRRTQARTHARKRRRRRFCTSAQVHTDSGTHYTHAQAGLHLHAHKEAGGHAHARAASTQSGVHASALGI